MCLTIILQDDADIGSYEKQWYESDIEMDISAEVFI